MLATAYASVFLCTYFQWGGAGPIWGFQGGILRCPGLCAQLGGGLLKRSESAGGCRQWGFRSGGGCVRGPPRAQCWEQRCS